MSLTVEEARESLLSFCGDTWQEAPQFIDACKARINALRSELRTFRELQKAAAGMYEEYQKSKRGGLDARVV